MSYKHISSPSIFALKVISFMLFNRNLFDDPFGEKLTLSLATFDYTDRPMQFSKVIVFLLDISVTYIHC